MYKVNINSQKQGNFFLHLATLDDVNQYIAECATSGLWGTPARVEVILAKPATLDEQGNVLEPEVPEQQIVHPETYTITYEDISTQVAQEATNKASLEYLANTDWLIVRELETGVKCPEEIKVARAAARAAIVR